MPAPLVALVCSAALDRAALVGKGVRCSGAVAEVLARVAELEAELHPRWVWWAAGHDALPAVRHGIRLQRCWDLAEAHRLLAGGWAADPALVWATALGLPVDGIPRRSGDLFDFAAAPAQPPSRLPLELAEHPGVGELLDPAGYLRPDALAFLDARNARIAPVSEGGRGAEDGGAGEDPLVAWGRAALLVAARQRARLGEVSAMAVTTAGSESAAALLCVELERSGLPVDLHAAEDLIAAAAGPRPTSPEHARAVLAERDAVVLRHHPRPDPGRSVDLRNPGQVKDLLASAGVVVQDTRAWRLEPFRESSPLVAALLQWRKAERIATTYGYAWLDAGVGSDGRLRGQWTASDGAAGRMTASNGLHNLPRPLRPAVAAAPGHVFVRADLGQIEPRVLAAVSGDAAFARDTQAADLYAPVADRLGVDRARAKIAVLAAMYGQTSGAAGQALEGLQRAYPTAIAYLEAAYEDGVAGRAVRTYGGRRVPMGGAPADRGALAGRGRFARNAVVQGAAAELFKAWAATVRLGLHELAGGGAEIVLCLHDELLVHAPESCAADAVAVLERSLTDAAHRWTGSDRVRFVADTRVLNRWSEAKD